MDFWHSNFLPILLLCAMAANLVLPYCWGIVWRAYHPLKKDTLLLYDPDSPVRWLQRLWRLVLGVVFILGGVLFYSNISSTIWVNHVLLYAMLGFGCFGCIIPACFSLTDIKYVDSVPAKLHNVCYLFGMICLLVAALCATTVAFESGASMRGAVFSIINLISIFAFMIYMMSDRQECRDTIIGYEGVWEFVVYLLAFVPIGCTAVLVLLS